MPGRSASWQSSVVTVPAVVPSTIPPVVVTIMPTLMMTVVMTMVMTVVAPARPVGLTICGRRGVTVNRSRIPGHRRRANIATTPNDIHAEPDLRFRVPGLGDGNAGQTGQKGGQKQTFAQHEN